MEPKNPPLASKQLEPLLTPLSDIKPHPDNYKIHTPEQLASLRASLNAFGCTQPIKVNLEGYIVAGHGMYQLYQEEGFTHAPVIYEALDKRLSKAYLVADNETSRKAETDSDKLALLLQDAAEIPDFDIEAVGFSSEDIDSLLKGCDVGEVVEDEFTEDEITIDTDIKKGDLIELGNHLLLCGDATNKHEIGSLVSDHRISMVFTDPPYDMPLDQVLKAFSVTSSYSDLQFWMASDKQQIELVYNNFDKFTHFFIHDFKCATLISNSQPMQRHNLIAKFGNKKMNNLQDGFTTIVQVATERTSEAHKIFRMGKRVELPAQFISHYSQTGEYILDVFGGSGSTLIACEQLKRKCLINELEPERCELIKRRYEQFKQT